MAADKVNPRAVGKKPKTALMTVRMPTPVSEWFDALSAKTGYTRNDLMKSALGVFFFRDDCRGEAIKLILDPTAAWQLNMDAKPEMSEGEMADIAAAVKARNEAEKRVFEAQQALAQASQIEADKKIAIMRRTAEKYMPPDMKAAVEKRQQEAAAKQDEERHRSIQNGWQ